MSELPYKISVLVFVKDENSRLLLIERAKEPNKGCWSPIGGKLEMQSGESPFECALRETKEEIGLEVKPEDMHLFCMVAEKSYEGKAHWLMFLFDCKKPLEALPKNIDEGGFKFFSREEINSLRIPDTDKQILWNCYDNFREGFTAISVDCAAGGKLEFKIEQQI